MLSMHAPIAHNLQIEECTERPAYIEQLAVKTMCRLQSPESNMSSRTTPHTTVSATNEVSGQRVKEIAFLVGRQRNNTAVCVEAVVTSTGIPDEV